MSNRCLIIAEAGVNHNGDLDLAYRLIDAAALAGADIVKFQTFQADQLVTPAAQQAEYQKKNIGQDEGQYAMLRRLEIDEEAHHLLIAHCQKVGIRFWSTAFDSPSITLLQKLGVNLWKIPSGEITNLPYLRRIGSFGQQVVLSTGMCSLGEVEQAIDVLVKMGTSRSQIILLHCTTEYPAPIHEVNLRAMLTMAQAFGMQVGYSDHTQGIEVSIAAAALGACVIEKHFTLDRSLPGPDHLASLEPNELKALVSSIRNVEQALGNGIKQPTDSERRNIAVARKSIVAATTIENGQLFTLENLTTMRPGSGISPMELPRVLGRRASQRYQHGDLIQW